MKPAVNRKRSGPVWTAVLAGLVLLGASAPAFAGPEVGSPAIDFTLPDHTGTDRSLSDYAGKVIVLALLTPS